jgi:hypothetical protein
VFVKVTRLPEVENEPAAVGVAVKVTVVGADAPTPSQASVFVE